MAANWYYARDGRRAGPIPSEQLKKLVVNEVVSPDDLVWREGLQHWVPARQVQGLCDGLPPAIPGARTPPMPPEPPPPPPAVVVGAMTANRGARPAEYDQVPAYRRSGVNSLLCLLGIFFAPAIVWVCIVVLTGPVYEPYLRQDGTLKTWSIGNKMAAVLILILEVVVWVQVVRLR